MGFLVMVIFIVIFAVLPAVKKQNELNKKQEQNKDKYTEASSYYRESESNKRASYNQTGTFGSSKTFDVKNTTANTMKNKAAAAQRSKADASPRSKVDTVQRSKEDTAQKFRQMAGVEASDGAILSAAKMHSYATELDNELDSREDLMKPVYDIMVKGPDTSVPNERDFLSEAADMLNSYVMDV